MMSVVLADIIFILCKGCDLMNNFIKDIDNILDYIEENDKFLVTSHVSPDGDNIGSSLSINNFLKKIGKEVIYVLDDNYTENLMFLYDEDVKKESSDVKSSDYTVIALDAGDYSRICVDKNILEDSKGIICIDHHVTNGNYGFLKYIDVEGSSTCELVYNLIMRYEERFNRKIIDEDIATYLYAGLITDTGNFQYSNTEESSFFMAAELISRGAKKSYLVEKLFQSNSLEFYKILGEALENLEIIDSKISITAVAKEMMDKHKVKYDDIDGITPYTRDIKGVELGIFIKEKEIGEIKVSFRSKNYVDCSKLASEFGGGGHIRAAGCTIKDLNIDLVRKLLIEKAVEYINIKN